MQLFWWVPLQRQHVGAAWPAASSVNLNGAEAEQRHQEAKLQPPVREIRRVLEARKD